MVSNTLEFNELKTIVDQSQILIWRSNTDGLCDYFNSTWLAFSGRTLDQELGNGWAEGVHREDYNRCLKIYQDHFKEQKVFEMEYRLRRHDGVYRWIFDKGVPFYDDAGVFCGYIGSCFDIHERRVEHEHIRALSIVARETDNSVVIADKYGKIEWVNDSFSRMTEYQLEEVIGKKPGHVLQGENTRPEDIEYLKTNLNSLKPFNCEIYNYNKSGRGYWIQMYITPIFNEENELYKFVAIQSDITKRKLEEEELLRAKEAAIKSERNLKQTQSIAKVGGWEFDLPTGLFHFNDNFYEIFRSSVAIIGGYTMTAEEYTQKFFHPDDFDVVIDMIRKAVETNDSNFSSYQEVKILFEDGKEGYMGVKFFIQKDELGKTTKIFGVNQDITERRKIESEIIVSKNQAERNEEKYKLLFANVEIGIVLHAKDTSIISCNERSQELLRLSEAQMKGKEAIDPHWKFISENGQQLPIEDYPVMKVLRSGQRQKSQILGVVNSELDVVWLLVSGYPEKSNDGEIDTVTISFIDITNLKKALEDKDRLFKELHHRIKNNLHMVSSLMYTKSLTTVDDNLKEFITETINRVNSIAKIHDRLLHLEALDKLMVKRYFEDLIHDIIHSLAFDPEKYMLELDIEDHQLTVDDTLALGLIINESISNIIKHAYKESKEGVIRVLFKKKQDEYSLVIEDEGKGFELNESKEFTSLGLFLIDQLANQLNGKIIRSTKDGCSFTLNFKSN